MIEIKTKSEFFDDESKRLEADSVAVHDTLLEIKTAIQKNKDKAILNYTEKFDQVTLSNLIVTKEYSIQNFKTC